MIAAIQLAVAVMLVVWAGNNCTRIDVKTGRRESMALVDDYGSNRGWYWPWSYINVAGFLMGITAPGTLFLLTQ